MSTRNSLRGGVLLAVVVGLMAFSLPAFAQVLGSAHDLNTFPGVTMPSSQTCVACHTPHNADITVAEAPLWNHEMTASAHTPYSGGGTLNATVPAPGGISLLCLSCHDGTVAVDSFGGSTGTNFLAGNENLGTDLSDDHPISFVYDLALSGLDGALEDPATALSTLGGTIAQDMLFGVGNTNLECASCHDVHNGPGTTGALLRISNVGSALCTTCHVK